MSKEATNVEAEATTKEPGRIAKLMEKPWVKTTGKVAKETSKVLGGIAIGVGGTIAYLKFSGE